MEAQQEAKQTRAAAEQAQQEMLLNVDMAVLAQLPESLQEEISKAMRESAKSSKKNQQQTKQKSIASFFKQRPS